jgi:ribosome biogenesis GTPase
MNPKDVMNFDQFERLHAIGLTAALAQQVADLETDPDAQPMRVLEVHREHLLLHNGAGERRGRPTQRLLDRLAVDDQALAVGDWVLACPQQAAPDRVIERLMPTRQLCRRVNDGRGATRRQVLVSNVDLALLVMGLDQDYNLRRLERYLALVRLAGVAPVLLLTKADTVELPLLAHRLASARELMPAGAPVLAVDGRDASLCDRLWPWLGRGRTLVLLGSSGAGKSTLTNTLAHATGGRSDPRVSPSGGAPEVPAWPPRTDAAPQRTQSVRAGDDRGRHTTTVRSLHFTRPGACIIDTPGLRALRLDAGDPAQLDAVFDDVARLAPHCRFRDCRHQDEPGCAVREELPPQRLCNYQKLLREARRDSMTALERREQLAIWKARGRAGHARAKAKRGEPNQDP